MMFHILVALMKDRSEVLFMFKLFQKEILNQFGCSIKVLHSDKTLDYMHSAFKNTTCRYYA